MTYDATMTVRRVFAHADICYEQQIMHILANGSQRTLHNARFVVTVRTNFVLLFRDSKQQDTAKSGLLRLPCDLNGLVDRKVELSGHRTDLFAHAAAWAHEDRIDH